MKKCAFFWVVFVILVCQVGPVTDAQADVVGRLTQVEGRVDILRGGQLPATPVKVDDGVQTGDVLRTKSLSKAQITFIDNTTLAIAPESRVAIEEYMFDPAKQKRSATIQLFQGLAHVVVSKLFKSAEPDFVVKTQTAIMGIRGTEFGIRLQPNGSTILNFEGVLQVGSIYPEVGQLDRKAFKVAYSSPRPWDESVHGWVQVNQWHGTFVGNGLPPTVPYHIGEYERNQFLNQMGTGLPLCRRRDAGSDETGGGAPSETISSCAATTGEQGGDTSGGNQGLGLLYGFQQHIIIVQTPPKVQHSDETAAPTNLPETETNLPIETQATLFSFASFGTPETPETPENPPTKPPCDHEWRHHFHRHFHHHFHFDRDFFCHRDHDGRFGFPFNWDFCRPVEHNGQFEPSRAPWEHHLAYHRFGESQWDNRSFNKGRDCFNQRDRDRNGQLEHSRVTTLRTQHNLTDFHGTGPVSGHFRGEGRGPTITNFNLTSTITNPTVLLSQNGPGNAPGPMSGHHQGPGSGPTTTNFIRNTAITNPRVLLSQQGPGNAPGPMSGHFKGGGPGPTITNLNLTTAITNPRALLSQQGPGNAPGEMAGNRVGQQNGPAPAVLSLKDKSPPKGNTHQGGPVNPSLRGGLRVPLRGR